METTAEHDSEMQFGPHHVRFLPPDVFHVCWRGEARVDDVARLFAFSDSIVKTARYFVLADLKEMTSASPQGRKLAAEDPRSLQIGALAMLHANFQTRVVITMMERALRILRRGRSGRIAFFDQEADALAWIDSERRRLDQV